ncbi:hypothetical protein [Streptomyces sp. NPDC019890]|uniref:hypothetical protein n=1 Tax=Streptomyces sp. NPDC019890 TaxID=3365064 RepID=UPI003850DDA9
MARQSRSYRAAKPTGKRMVGGGGSGPTHPYVQTHTAPLTRSGDSDPKTTLDEAKAWGQHTTGSLDLRVFTGGHFFVSEQSTEVMQVLKQHFRTEGARTAG